MTLLSLIFICPHIKLFKLHIQNFKTIFIYLPFRKDLFCYVCYCHFCSSVCDISSERKYIRYCVPITIIFFLLYFIHCILSHFILGKPPKCFPRCHWFLLFQSVDSDSGCYWWDFNSVTVFYLSWNNSLFYIIFFLLQTASFYFHLIFS